MFDALADRFDGIFTKLRSRGRLTEKDIDEVAREIRRRAARGRRQRRASSSVHRPGEGARDRRGGGEEPDARPAGHQDRPRGARRDARRHDRQAHDELEAADGRDAGRPAGLREDDRRRQARAAAEDAGPAAAARRCRPAAPGRGRAAARARGARRRAGLLASRPIRSTRRARRASRKRRGSVATS